jgi:hypothetical protein
VFRAAIVVMAPLMALAASGAELPLRDPMQPFRAVEGADDPGAGPAPRFRLTAVLIAPTRRVAIVNGKPYQQGAHVDGAKITRIDSHSIQIRNGGEELVVYLGNRRPSKPAVEGVSRQ